MSSLRELVLGRRVALALVAAFVAFGCAGPDPGFLTFSDGSSSSGGSGSSGSAAKVNQVFASEVYPAVSSACGGCHLSGTNSAPIFFGEDAAKTYPLFKGQKFHLPESAFVTKGAHAGPALTPEQRAAVDKWVADEGGGG